MEMQITQGPSDVGVLEPIDDPAFIPNVGDIVYVPGGHYEVECRIFIYDHTELSQVVIRVKEPD